MGSNTGEMHMCVGSYSKDLTHMILSQLIGSYWLLRMQHVSTAT